MNHLIMIAALLALAGCATCQRYPVMCTVAGAIVVGSVAATLAQHDHRDPPRYHPLCAPNCAVQ